MVSETVSRDEIAGAIELQVAKDGTPPTKQAVLEIRESTPITNAPVLSKFAFTMVFVGLAFGVFLTILDQTIVAVALQAISADFNDLDQINWIATGYLLTSTAFIPVYGQFADILGRKTSFLIGITIFEIGSLLCGAAVNMDMLIAGRAIAGMGGSGVFSLVIIIVSDLTTEKERGQYMGILTAVYGLASVTGPLLGGVLVDHVTWRWVFYLNLPFGAFTIGVVILFLTLPNNNKEPLCDSLQRIDWIGAFLLITGVICLLIPIQGGGSQYAWNSSTVIVLFILGFFFIGAFVYFEGWAAKNPLLPFSLFNNRQTIAAFATMFWLGCGLLVIIFYTPIWFQIVKGSTATQAGIKTIPNVAGLVFFAILSGIVGSVTGYYFPFVVLSSILFAVGSGLISTMNEYSANWKQIVFLIIAGGGPGSGFQSVLMAAQTSVAQEVVASVTATSNFFQTIGAVVGIAIASSLFNNNLIGNIQDAFVAYNTSLAELQPAGLLDPTIIFTSPSSIHNASIVADGSTLQAALVHGYLETLSPLFHLPIIFAVLMLVCAFFLKKDRIVQGTEIAVGA
ncbi:hypothetical protein HK100_006640 [Physocladia obscura]|uniref:Major facilitator superfamily (MFS) profile domain-containing protein n=1 Tax=Physocladia obscura TaxID=109957 RepID=A0AAD5SR60_9FUNG|nr:hypothetical protein HK100_006640 [Physocladia obscura]